MLNRTFRQTLAPFTCIRYLKTIYFFVIRFIGFVLFSPVWPIVHSYPAVTTVTENASFQNAFQSADFWLLLILVYVWTDENGGFRILYHDVIHHIPRELCMLSKGVLSYFHRFLNWVDGRKLWIRYMWKRIFRGAGIKFPFSKIPSFFFYQNIFYKIIEAETCKILRLF